VKKEPYAALYGGEDGLIFYNKIIKDYSVFLKENGFFLFEIGYDQGASLKSIAKKYGYTCEIIKDYSGNDRVAYIKK
jgi:release factor glutamine methyltransferase